jgi:chorismate mutase / prephenate dehydratase
MRTLLLGFSAMALFAQNADLAKQLTGPRQRIDSIDKQIVNLLNERAQVVRDIGLIKKKYNAPVSAPGREEQVVRRAGEQARAPLSAPAVEAIYRTILHEMSAMEQTEVEHSR